MKVTIECDGVILYGIPEKDDELRLIMPKTSGAMAHVAVLFLVKGQVEPPEIAAKLRHGMLALGGKNLSLHAESVGSAWKSALRDHSVMIEGPANPKLPTNHGSDRRTCTVTLVGGEIQLSKQFIWKSSKDEEKCVGEVVTWSGEVRVAGEELKIPGLGDVRFRAATDGELRFMLRHVPLEEVLPPDPSVLPNTTAEHLHMLYDFVGAPEVTWVSTERACGSALEASAMLGTFRRCLGAAVEMI